VPQHYDGDEGGEVVIGMSGGITVVAEENSQRQRQSFYVAVLEAVANMPRMFSPYHPQTNGQS